MSEQITHSEGPMPWTKGEHGKPQAAINKSFQLVRIFVASPGDVLEERNKVRQVINDLNMPNGVAGQNACRLELLDWIDVVPGSGRPEEVILRQFPPESWDIFIGILWKRFGTPSGEKDPETGRLYMSGTEEEFQIAYRLYQENKLQHILVYVRDSSEPPKSKSDSDDQLNQIKAFLNGFEQSGDHPGLYMNYKTPHDFENKIRNDLIRVLPSLNTREPLKISATMPSMAPPTLSGRLFGSERLLQEMKEQLLKKKSLGIIGLPGVGKTAIAATLAHDPEILEHFQPNVFWADFGLKPDVLDILGKLATALNIQSESIADSITIEARQEAIRRKISACPMLLVIDDAWGESEVRELKKLNCTYIITTTCRYVAACLADKPFWIEELNEEDGLSLLATLAHKAVEVNNNLAKKLVSAVGGIPLALILIGKYLKMKSFGTTEQRIVFEMEELLKESEKPIKLTPPGEAGSVEALIGISYDALEKKARQALKFLSVFPPKPSSFSKEAAEAVSNVPIKILYDLSDYGLIEDLGQRFTMNKIIVDFAREKPKRGISPYKRLVEYFIPAIEAHEKDYAYLDEEQSNILAVLQAACDHNMPGFLLRGVNAFYHFMEARGLYDLAEKWLEEAKKAVASIEDKVRVLLHLGTVVTFRGHYEDAEKYYWEGMKLAEELEDDHSICALHQGLGEAAHNLGKFSDQEKHCKQGLELAEKIKDHERSIDLLTSLGTMKDLCGDYENAEKYFQQAEEHAIAEKDDEKLSCLLSHRGWVSAHLGDFKKAEQYWQEGLNLAKNKGNIVFLMSVLGWVRDRGGDYKQAEKYFQEGLVLAREIGYLYAISVLLTNMGAARIHRGEYSQAKEFLKESLDIDKKTGHAERMGVTLENLGIVESRCGNFEGAETYFKQGLCVPGVARWIKERKCALYTFLGELECFRGEYPQSEEYLKKAHELAKEIRNPERFATVYKIHGILLDKQGDCKRAKDCLEKSLHYAQKIDYRWLISSIHNALAEHCLKKSPESAFREFHKAKEIAKEIDSKDMYATALYGLAQFEAVMKDFKQARDEAQKSLSTFEDLGHYKRHEVKEWLTGLPKVDV